MSVEFWAEFFQAAGLEPAVAASYANIFFVNKIQRNHLPDIDRDALKEMNITPMGDILTILRYIKISFAAVTTRTAIPGNEQPLLHRDDILKSPVQFRNIQDSKTEYCGQNQYGCGAQHTIQIDEKVFQPRFSPSAYQTQPSSSTSAAHYVRSAEIPADCKLPPTAVVHESPLNLSVHGNSYSKKKIVSEHYNEPFSLFCNSINATVPCDSSETAGQGYSISPIELEMCSNIDALKNNADTSMSLSDVESCDWQQPLSLSLPVVSSTVLQCNKPMTTNHELAKKETLLRRSLEQRSKQDCSHNIVPDMKYSKSTLNQRLTKAKVINPGGRTHQQKRSVFDRLGEQSKVEEVLDKPGLQQFHHDQQYSKELRLKSIPQRDNGVMRNNHLRKQWQYMPIDDDRVNINRESANTVAVGPEPLPEESFHVRSKICNEDSNKELISVSHLNTDKIGPQYGTPNSIKQIGDVTNGNFNDVDTPNAGSGAGFIIHTPPGFSSSLQSEDLELESLREPTLTRHKEEFYLAWTDRRKHAYSFPGHKPSFLQVS